MNAVESAIARIKPLNQERLDQALIKLDGKTKPPGALGRLEEFACRMAAINGTLSPVVNKKVIYTFAGDHGITEEGVALYPKAVTTQMVHNFLAGGAGVNVLARHVGAEVRVVDVGVDNDFGGLPDRLAAG